MFIDTDRSLRKLSIYKPMNFRIVEIDFDFDDAMSDEEITTRRPGFLVSLMLLSPRRYQ